MKKEEIIERIKQDALEYESDIEAKVKEFETLGRVEFYKYGTYCTHFFKRYIPIDEKTILIKSWKDCGFSPMDIQKEVITCE